jgi:hypothetical protein
MFEDVEGPVEFPGTMTLNETDDDTLVKAAVEAETSATSHSSEGDLLLLHTENPIKSREKEIFDALGVQGDVFHMPRVDEFKSPREDKRFYELAFPQLYPFGFGGLGLEDTHKLKKSELVQLMLKRGGDQRFSKNKPWMFAVYTDHFRSASGGVAFAASRLAEAMGNFAQPEESAADAAAGDGAPVEVAARRGDVLTELQGCPTAQDIVEALTAKKGQALHRIMSSLEGYSNPLPGTALHIKNERKQLFAMMESDATEGVLRWFGTNAPADRCILCIDCIFFYFIHLFAFLTIDFFFFFCFQVQQRAL